MFDGVFNRYRNPFNVRIALLWAFDSLLWLGIAFYLFAGSAWLPIAGLVSLVYAVGAFYHWSRRNLDHERARLLRQLMSIRQDRLWHTPLADTTERSDIERVLQAVRSGARPALESDELVQLIAEAQRVLREAELVGYCQPA